MKDDGLKPNWYHFSDWVVYLRSARKEYLDYRNGAAEFKKETFEAIVDKWFRKYKKPREDDE